MHNGHRRDLSTMMPFLGVSGGVADSFSNDMQELQQEWQSVGPCTKSVEIKLSHDMTYVETIKSEWL